MAVELWDDKDGNLIDDFNDEAEALACIRETVAEHGTDAVATWALDRFTAQRRMVRGAELLELAIDIPA